MTMFVVLAQIPKTDDRPQAWGEVARVNAGSKEQALRSIGGTGTFVAVPARSWTPVRMDVKTVERVTITAAQRQEVSE
jgi:hypothetical protein